MIPGTGVRTRLLLLAAICTLPVFALLVYDAWQASRDEIDATRTDLRTRVSAAALDLDRDIRTAQSLLQSMTRVPEIADVASPACSQQLVLLSTPYAQVGTASGLDAAGTLRCTSEPEVAPINLADRDYFRRALASTTPVLGRTVQSRRNAGVHVLPVALAIRDAAGKPTGVLVVGINLDNFAQDNAAAWADAGTLVTLWSDDARILYRWPDADGWIGKAYGDTPLGRELLARPTGAYEGIGADNVARLRALATVGKTGMRLTQSVPRASLVAPHEQALVRNIAWLTLITLVGFAAAWMFGERLIRRPLASLARVAGRMRAGDLGARTNGRYSRDEVGEVAQAFDAMAESMAAQFAELHKTEEGLRASLGRAHAAEQRVRQQLEHMNLLDQITRAIGERQDLHSIFQVVVRALEDSLPLDFCCIACTIRMRTRCASSGSASRAARSRSRWRWRSARRSASTRTASRAACAASSSTSPTSAASRFPFPERLREAGLRSLVIAPLLVGEPGVRRAGRARGATRMRSAAATASSCASCQRARRAGRAPGAAVRRAAARPTRTCGRRSRR